jgi:hypothetical protein
MRRGVPLVRPLLVVMPTPADVRWELAEGE